MKKLLLLLCTLLGTVGAWAETYQITYDTSTGTFYRDGSASTTWSSKWVSNEEGKPVVTVSTDVNNMNGDNGRMAPRTYTITVEDGCIVTGFTMNCPTFGGEITVTPNGESAVVVETGANIVVNSSATSFVFSGDSGCRIQAASSDGGSFIINVEGPSAEQKAAYNKAQSWFFTLQEAEGLVKNATNYTTNAQEASEGPIASLLDGDYTTFFHSSWNNGPAADHYLQATLPEAVDAFYFYFKKRSQNQANRPTSITISGSNDGTNFTDITTINSGLPTTKDVIDYASSKINLGASYQYIRFTVTATNTPSAVSNGHVFFTFSEFYLLPSNDHVVDAMEFYHGGKLAREYSAEDIAQINAIDLEVRNVTIAPAKANVIAAYAIPDGKVGTVGYPTQAAWDTFVNAINAITVDDDFDTAKNAAIDALMASAKLTNGVYKIRNYSTNHYLYQDEADAIVTYATTETLAGNNGYWRVTDNGNGTYAILDLYSNQLTKGNQGTNWAGVQGGSKGTVTTITRDYSNSNYKTSGDLVSFYLAGAHINVNYNTGSKVFVTTWTTGGLGSDANHWFFEPVDVSGLTAYTITVTGAPAAIAMGDGTSLVNGTSTVYLSGAEQIAAPEFENYEVSKVVEGTTATITYTITNYEALVEAYLTEDKLQNIQQAGKIGYPSTSSEAFENLYNLISNFTSGHTYTASDYENIQSYYSAYISSEDIVLPEVGKFYRIKGYSGNYITYNTAGSNASMNGTKSVDNILCYDEDGYLIFYKDGLGLAHTHTVAAIGTTLNAYTFSRGAQFGKMYLKSNGRTVYSNNDGEYCYDNTAASPSKLDRNGSAVTSGSYQTDWTVEEVTTLPVTISEAGYATLYAPVALTIPANVTAYTGEVNGNYLTLTALEETIPANTAVILKAAAGNYDFAATTADAFTGDNDLKGTLGGKAVVAKSILTLQNDGEVGLYTYTGTSLAGFKAYLEKPSSATVKLSFRFSDPTAIKSIVKTSADKNIFNLAGQRMSTLKRGVNIVNGKKVVVK